MIFLFNHDFDKLNLGLGSSPFQVKKVKIVAVVDRWSLFRGHLSNKILNWDLKLVTVIDRWPLENSINIMKPNQFSIPCPNPAMGTRTSGARGPYYLAPIPNISYF